MRFRLTNTRSREAIFCLCLIILVTATFFALRHHGTAHHEQSEERGRERRGVDLEDGVAFYVGCFRVAARIQTDLSLPYFMGALECLLLCHASRHKFACLGTGGSMSPCLCLEKDMPGTVLKVRNSLCDIPCVSNPDFPCGGPDVYSVYYTGVQKDPTDMGTFENLTQEGCYPKTNATIVPQDLAFSTGRLSPVLCVYVCNLHKFKYAGTFAGFICICKNTLPPENTQLPADSCLDSKCGDENYLNESCGSIEEVMFYRTRVLEHHATDWSPSKILPRWLFPDLSSLHLKRNIPKVTEKMQFQGVEWTTDEDGVSVLVENYRRTSRMSSSVPVIVFIILFILMYKLKRARMKHQKKLNTLTLYPLYDHQVSLLKERKRQKQAEETSQEEEEDEDAKARKKERKRVKKAAKRRKKEEKSKRKRKAMLEAAGKAKITAMIKGGTLAEEGAAARGRKRLGHMLSFKKVTKEDLEGKEQTTEDQEKTTESDEDETKAKKHADKRKKRKLTAGDKDKRKKAAYDKEKRKKAAGDKEKKKKSQDDEKKNGSTEEKRKGKGSADDNGKKKESPGEKEEDSTESQGTMKDSKTEMKEGEDAASAVEEPKAKETTDDSTEENKSTEDTTSEKTEEKLPGSENNSARRSRTSLPRRRDSDSETGDETHLRSDRRRNKTKKK